jgi:acyl carrier protein
MKKAESEILHELNEIFRDVFKENEMIIDASTSPNEIERWDSMSQALLILKMEEKYNITIDPYHFLKIQNVGEICTIISEKMD